MVEYGCWRLCAGRRHQPVLVVFQEQAPCVGIADDKLQYGLPGIVRQRLVPKRSGEQAEGFPGLVETAFGQSALVHGEAAHQMFPQGAGGPLAEAHAPLGIDPVAHGDDGVQIVVPDVASDLSFSLRPNY